MGEIEERTPTMMLAYCIAATFFLAAYIFKIGYWEESHRIPLFISLIIIYFFSRYMQNEEDKELALEDIEMVKI